MLFPLESSPLPLCTRPLTVLSCLFQGPLNLSFQADPLQQPLELVVQEVSSVARSAQEKVSWVWKQI